MENVYLPRELELAVLARLDKQDLKTVRLVSRERSALATGPFVRGGLYILQGARLGSLQEYHEASGH